MPKGSVMARLDPADYRRDRDEAAEKLASAEADLAKDEADSELARNELRRGLELAPSGAIGKEDPTADAALATVKRGREANASQRPAGRGVGPDCFSEQGRGRTSAERSMSPRAGGAVQPERSRRARYAGQRVTANQKALVLDLTGELRCRQQVPRGASPGTRMKSCTGSPT